jgi:hypothetical protein
MRSKTLRGLLVPILMAVTLPALAEDWITFRPTGMGFSVQLPAAPRHPSPGPGQWQAFDTLKRLYGIVVTSATPGLEPSEAQLTAIMEGVAQQSNGTIQEKRFFKYRDLQACEFRIATLSSQVSVTRIVVAPRRRYVLSFVSSTRNFHAGTAKKFFDSLLIAKEPGK